MADPFATPIYDPNNDAKAKLTKSFIARILDSVLPPDMANLPSPPSTPRSDVSNALVAQGVPGADADAYAFSLSDNDANRYLGRTPAAELDSAAEPAVPDNIETRMLKDLIAKGVPEEDAFSYMEKQSPAQVAAWFGSTPGQAQPNNLELTRAALVSRKDSAPVPLPATLQAIERAKKIAPDPDDTDPLITLVGSDLPDEDNVPKILR
jgi:hypothetical protein